MAGEVIDVDGVVTAEAFRATYDVAPQIDAVRRGRAPEPTADVAVAVDRGWIDVDPASETFRGLNVLVATLRSARPLREDYRPRFPVDGVEDVDRVAWALHRAGVAYRYARSDGETALTPSEHPRILGRILAVLGAPRPGEDPGWPHYLDDVGQLHRRAFARTYLANKGPSDEEHLTIEDEPYPEVLAAFLADVAHERIEAAEACVHVPVAALRNLGFD